MKRDMDLIRRIVLTIADAPTMDADLGELEGTDQAVFAQHVIWLKQAGLVEAITSEYMDGDAYANAQRLTWAGCDFADAIRDDTIWNAAKAKVLKPGASWTFDILKEWVKNEITHGFPTVRSLS